MREHLHEALRAALRVPSAVVGPGTPVDRRLPGTDPWALVAGGDPHRPGLLATAAVICLPSADLVEPATAALLARAPALLATAPDLDAVHPALARRLTAVVELGRPRPERATGTPFRPDWTAPHPAAGPAVDPEEVVSLLPGDGVRPDGPVEAPEPTSRRRHAARAAGRSAAGYRVDMVRRPNTRAGDDRAAPSRSDTPVTRPDVVASLLAALPWQQVRGRTDRLVVRPEDLCARRRRQRGGRLLVIVVDARSSCMSR